MEIDIVRKVWPQWKIQRQLGEGAFGRVYEATYTKFDVEDHSAIKVIKVPASSGEVDNIRAEGRSESETRQYFRGIVNDFVKEIQMMLSLDGSGNIVSVKDYDIMEKADEIGWYVLIRMELLTPYDRYVNEHPFSEADVIKLGCDICNALEVCAKQKIIHRDIKPANIMVHEGTGSFKLGDFGIARKLENTTGGMTVAGARNYIAPEVISEQKYDHRVDLYSLGLVLYRALNRNRMPFVSMSGAVTHTEANEGIRRRMSGEPLPPHCDASPEMAKVILRACAYKPEDRFASAAEMKHALEQVAAGNGSKTKKQDTKKRERTKLAVREETPRPTENEGSAETVRVRRAEEVAPAEGSGTIRVRPAPKAEVAPVEQRAAYNMDDPKQRKLCHKAAEQGKAEAQYCLGAYYARPDAKKPMGLAMLLHKEQYTEIYWYRKAAEQGHAEAQCKLGEYYYWDDNSVQHFAEMIKWYRKAAEQDYAEAQFQLGWCYEYGTGVTKDEAEAVKW